MASEPVELGSTDYGESNIANVAAPQIAVGILNSCCLMLVAAPTANETNFRFRYPQSSIGTSRGASVLEAATALVRETFSLEASHCAPVAVMESAGPSGVIWALFVCCDVIGDEDAAMMAKPAGEKALMSWQPLDELIASAPAGGQAPLQAFADWALPLMDDRHLTAVDTDLAGVWTRDASRNRGVVAALQARGHDAERAAAEASRPYVQRWRRCPGAASRLHDWEVTTYAAASHETSHETSHESSQSGPLAERTSGSPREREEAEDAPTGKRCKRVLVYSIGDWAETYRGDSVLFGSTGPAPVATGSTGQDGACQQQSGASALLVRRTSWLPQPEALPDAATAGEDESIRAAGLLPARCVAHTTWTSRTDHAAEVVSRFLRHGELIVRRTLVQTPLRVHAATPRVVSEEVFVRAPPELWPEDKAAAMD